MQNLTGKGNMKEKKLIWLIMSCLMAFSLVLASCGPAEEEEEEEVVTPPGEEEEVTPPGEEEEVIPPTVGDWWDIFGEPEYGGTITIRSGSDVMNFDRYYREFNLTMFNETLACFDWALDRKIFDFKMNCTPVEYHVGALAESWEQPDLQTVIFHIREGIHWQDKPPVNGRELTADDIAYHYHRYLGLGSGFTEGSPYYKSGFYFALIESVTATDKYTLVFKNKVPSLVGLEYLLDPAFYNTLAAPREVIDKYGDATDWKNAIGTSPWILADYVSGSSLTYVKNPNYWGHDERHPQNQLPYADCLKILIVPDSSTAYAALRTGKIDIMTNVDWEQAKNLAKTNPELVQGTLPTMAADLDIRVDKEPFTDIRVRKALNMAIDRELIAKTFYGGTSGTKAVGLTLVPGHYTPFDEWPKELQEEYSYNPDRAKELLAEAGYPNGFKTNVVCSTGYDLGLLQILQAYFQDINVDMDINVMEPPVFSSFVTAKKHDAMVANAIHGSTEFARVGIQRRLGGHGTNYTENNDPVYDEILDRFNASLDREEAKRLVKEADDYAIRQHWSVVVVPRVTYNIWQPWLKGYSGELMQWNWQYWYSRLWIDQDLKKSMGH
jgi:peptide/nickel transport system substrate-binding protein